MISNAEMFTGEVRVGMGGDEDGYISRIAFHVHDAELSHRQRVVLSIRG
jgi:hypothetical protein